MNEKIIIHNFGKNGRLVTDMEVLLKNPVAGKNFEERKDWVEAALNQMIIGPNAKSVFWTHNGFTEGWIILPTASEKKQKAGQR